MNIDHIGIAVKSIDDSLITFKKILPGVEPEFEEVEDQKVKVAVFHLGNSRIELLEATSPDSSIYKFIEKKGEGIHHIALGVEKIEDVLNSYKNNGVRLIDEKPKNGAGGKKIAFVHPKSVNGILTEITE